MHPLLICFRTNLSSNLTRSFEDYETVLGPNTRLVQHLFIVSHFWAGTYLQKVDGTNYADLILIQFHWTHTENPQPSSDNIALTMQRNVSHGDLWPGTVNVVLFTPERRFTNRCFSRRFKNRIPNKYMSSSMSASAPFVLFSLSFRELQRWLQLISKKVERLNTRGYSFGLVRNSIFQSTIIQQIPPFTFVSPTVAARVLPGRIPISSTLDPWSSEQMLSNMILCIF